MDRQFYSRVYNLNEEKFFLVWNSFLLHLLQVNDTLEDITKLSNFFKIFRYLKKLKKIRNSKCQKFYKNEKKIRIFFKKLEKLKKSLKKQFYKNLRIWSTFKNIKWVCSEILNFHP